MERSPAQPASGLLRELTLRHVIAMTLVGMVPLRWIARAARMGAPSVLLWIVACITFFVPLAAGAQALSRRYPEQGGLYAWTREASGPWHGFICEANLVGQSAAILAVGFLLYGRKAIKSRGWGPCRTASIHPGVFALRDYLRALMGRWRCWPSFWGSINLLPEWRETNAIIA